jgi:hypothetical protein
MVMTADEACGFGNATAASVQAINNRFLYDAANVTTVMITTMDVGLPVAPGSDPAAVRNALKQSDAFKTGLCDVALQTLSSEFPEGQVCSAEIEDPAVRRQRALRQSGIRLSMIASDDEELLEH